MADKLDRELLELAARAAGIDLDWPQDYGGAEHLWPRNNFTGNLWNPLTDDGDALRLAVNLRMDISVGQSVKVVAVSNDGETVAKEVHVLDNNPYTTTRRAIVCSAAAIGEAIGSEARLKR